MVPKTASVLNVVLTAAMKIWTIQSDAAWRALQNTGTLTAKTDHQCTEWPEAYNWMHTQLANRIGPPPRQGIVPLWGWAQHHSILKPRPDIRSLRTSWAPSGRWHLIECDLPEDELLLSDFDAWHIVLMGSYLALNEQKEEAHPQPSREQITRSWDRVFDLDALDSRYWRVKEQKQIQCCFWRLMMDQVIDVTSFVSSIAVNG